MSVDLARWSQCGQERSLVIATQIIDNPIHRAHARERLVNLTGRNEPLPRQMQGRWIGADDPLSELVVDGGEIVCFGAIVNYDHKVVSEEGGALNVSLDVADESRLDDFQRENIAGLVITPEGRFLVYNVRFGLEFVRPSS